MTNTAVTRQPIAQTRRKAQPNTARNRRTRGLPERDGRRLVRRALPLVAVVLVLAPVVFGRRLGAVNGGLRRPEVLMLALPRGLALSHFYRLTARM